MDYFALFKKAEAIVFQAGQAILTEMNHLQVDCKGVSNYVTNLDVATQRRLVADLTQLLPGCGFICEENTEIPAGREQSAVWVIDPVDGTTNLMHRFPAFTISVALMVENVLQLGFVYNPSREEMFSAQKGVGSFLNGSPIHVSSHKELAHSLLAMGMPYDRALSAVILNAAGEMVLRCQDLRRTGSAAYELACIACGRVDGFFEINLNPWDVAAGMLLVEEAGGSVVRWDGSAGHCLKSNQILASNGLIQNELVQVASQFLEQIKGHLTQY